MTIAPDRWPNLAQTQTDYDAVGQGPKLYLPRLEKKNLIRATSAAWTNWRDRFPTQPHIDNHAPTDDGAGAAKAL